MLTIKNFGVCKVSVAPVRLDPSDSSEIVTQLLFGDPVIILEKGQPWIKIRFEADNYEGWMDFKQLTYLEDPEYLDYLEKPIVYLHDRFLEIIGPLGKQLLMMGSRLPNFDGKSIRLGNNTYTFEVHPTTESNNIITRAFEYLNAPYLWGGKSVFGIDCSGFTQNVFKLHGKQLPRDASKQVLEGKDISFEERQVGDVPFFINAKGIVHHVGILVEKNQIIHAAGYVRIDPFDQEGIYREDLERYTHVFHSIRRFC
jgi:hypothetical protein